jgi:PilZ domain
MSNPKLSETGADWTGLLNDPDLASHLGELLQTYREAVPENREQALLETMRKIKRAAAKPSEKISPAADIQAKDLPGATTAAAPPFEPDIFTPSWGLDRRRYPRLKCFVAVEVHTSGASGTVWGNLANTSLGGAFIETATPIAPGAGVEIGLWLSTGKIWVKGIVLSGVVTVSTPQLGVRVKFAELQPNERETLREFLKYIEGETKGYRQEHGYLAQLKR